MTQQVANLPLLGTLAGFRRFSVDEYHRLTAIGMLTEDDNLELLEGYLVLKMARNPIVFGSIVAMPWVVHRCPMPCCCTGALHARTAVTPVPCYHTRAPHPRTGTHV